MCISYVAADFDCKSMSFETVDQCASCGKFAYGLNAETRDEYFENGKPELMKNCQECNDYMKCMLSTTTMAPTTMAPPMAIAPTVTVADDKLGTSSDREFINCANLPKSPNQGKFEGKMQNHPDGCPGAVWQNGNPSKSYCQDTVSVPWFAKCCEWKDEKCTAKSTEPATVAPTKAAAVFTRQNGYCANALKAKKIFGLTLLTCEHLCETTAGCFDGYFCGSSNCGGSGKGYVCNLFGTGTEFAGKDAKCGTVMPHPGQTKFTMTRN